MTLEAALATTTWWAVLLLMGVNPTFWMLVSVVRFGQERAARRWRRGTVWAASPRHLTPADVAILIPAHNEEVCIAATLDSAARLLPPSNIHVIADGCTDRTAEIARAYGANVLELNPSRGKAGGIEAAVKHFAFAERFAVMLVTDADTELAPDYLEHGLPLLDAPGTAALAGYAYSSWQPQNMSTVGRFLIAYRTRLYTAMQFLKYGQTWRFTNVAPIVPGFASMYRTSVLPHMDLNPPGLVIEDFNMTFELHRKRLGRIVFGTRSSATAQDPDNLRDYYKQITRWSLGFWQTLRRHGFWWSGFSLALGMFLVEVVVASTVMVAIAVGVVLAALAPLLPAAPEWLTGPVAFAATVLHPTRMLLFVAIPDYLLTIAVAAWMRRPSLLVYGVGFLFIRVIDATATFWALIKLFRTRSNGRWSSPTRRVVEAAVVGPAGPGAATAALIEAVEPGLVDEVALPSRTREAVRRAVPVVRDAFLVITSLIVATLLVVIVAVPIPAVMAASVLALALLALVAGRQPRRDGSFRRILLGLLVRRTRTRVLPAAVVAADAPQEATAPPAPKAPRVRPAPRRRLALRRPAVPHRRPAPRVRATDLPWPVAPPLPADPARRLPRRRPAPRVRRPVHAVAAAPVEIPLQDVVIVGGGVAGASVLVRLAAAATVAGARITLVDPAGETGGGAAYHRTVHPALLLNDPVSRIDRTGLGFGRWIAGRRDALGDDMEFATDPRVAAWYAGYGAALRAGEVAALFVPRRWFGDFIRERFAQATEDLAGLGTSVTVLAAAVVDLRPGTEGWSVETDRTTTVTARTVVLATGGPCRPPVADGAGYLCGTPGLDLDSVERALRKRPGTDLLVIGSAASAVEMVHCLEGDETLRKTVGRVVVVSPSGRLPDGLPSAVPADFEPGPALAAAGDADALMSALASEVAAARRLALTIPDIYPAVHAGFLTAFGALPEAEKKRIVDVHSRRYLTLLRKTSPVYARSARRLARRGELLNVAGRVTAIEPAGKDFTAVLDDGRRYRAGVVLDCRGFAGPASDPLLNLMIAGGHVTVNDSGLGLAVDPGFEAAPGMAVLGPLLAGTAQGGEYVWHLEDIPRIYAYADRIVATLLRRLASAAPPADAALTDTALTDTAPADAAAPADGAGVEGAGVEGAGVG